jgi:hypothetical protein
MAERGRNMQEVYNKLYIIVSKYYSAVVGIYMVTYETNLKSTVVACCPYRVQQKSLKWLKLIGWNMNKVARRKAETKNV